MKPDDAGSISTRNGLRVSKKAYDDWQARSRKNALDRRNKTPRMATSPKPKTTKKSESPTDWPAKVRKLAKKRSGGICETDNCTNAATELHHRKKRRHGDHRIENALHLCAVHHAGIHYAERRARDLGRIVHSTADPAAVVVQLNEHRRVLLTPTGTYQEAA